MNCSCGRDHAAERSSQAGLATHRCPEHGLSLPCPSCRADELVTPTPPLPTTDTIDDARKRAAGDHDR